MLTKFKISSLALAYVTALSMGFSATSFASCDQEIRDSQTNLDGYKVISTVLGVPYLFMSGPEAPAVAAVGLSSLAGAGVSVTIDRMNKLSDDEIYSYNVLSSASKKEVSTSLASFIKYTQKEIGRNKNAVIPTDDEIMNSLDYVNSNLSACRSEKDKFFKPKKQDLFKAVTKDLNL
jgi:hypothetical protein